MAHVVEIREENGKPVAMIDMSDARTHTVPGGASANTPAIKPYSQERAERLLQACEASGQDGSHFSEALKRMEAWTVSREMTDAKPRNTTAPAPTLKPDGLKH